MALVGEAHIVVRAITDKVNNDIRRGFSGASGIGRRAGEDFGSKFAQGFKSQTNANMFTRLSDGIDAMVPSANAARDAYRAMSAAGYALGPAVSSAVSGISALIGSLGALIGTAGTAAGALATLGNAYSAIGLGMGVAKLALGGIGGALTKATRVTAAGSRAAGAAAKRAVADARAERAARQAVNDAEKALARTIQDNRDRMVAANQAVAKAQQDLNDAIAKGRQELKDLAFQAEGAALDEKSAALDLQKARANLAAVQDLPPNSQARQEAELAYRQADLAYREAKSSAADYAKQQAQAAKTGIAGTQGYQDAAENLASAQADQAKTARDAAQSQADAEERLARARQNAKDAAQKTAGDAAGGGGGGGGGQDPFAGLNKYQREFAQFLLSLKPKLDELKLAASQAFLPPLQTAITILVNRAFPTVKRGVTEIAGAMGAAAITIAKAITTSQNLSKLGRLFSDSAGLIRTFGTIIGNVFGIALSILNASAPLAQHLADAIATATGKLDAFFNTKPGKDGLNAYFTESQRVLGRLGTIFSNIFKGISGIIKANFGAGSPGDQMLTLFTDATGKFAALNSDAKQPGLRAYFQDVVNNTKPILGLLGDIIGLLGHMGRQKSVGETFQILRDAVPQIRDLASKLNDAGPALARLVVKLVDLFNALQDSGALKIFLDTLTQIVDVVDGFAKSPAGGSILTLLGRFFAFSLAFTTAGKAAGFFSKVILGDLSHGFALLGNIGTGAGGIFQIGKTFGSVTRSAGGFKQALAELTYSSNGFARRFGEIGSKAVSGFAAARKGALTFADKVYFGSKRLAAMGVEAGKATAKAVVGFAKMAAGAVAAAAKTLAIRAAQIAVSVATRIAAAAQAAFNFVMNLNPIGLIITGITLLVGALVWFFTQTKVGQDIWANFTKFLGEAWNNVVNFIGGLINNITAWFQQWGPLVLAAVAPVIGIPLLIITHWNDIVAFFRVVWAGIVAVVRAYVNNVRTTVANVIGAIVTTWRNVWGGIRDFFGTIWRGMVAFYAPILRGIATFIGNVIGGIRNTWNGIWRGIGNFFHGIWDGIVDAVHGFGDTFHRIFNGIGGFVRTAFGGVLGAVRTPINGIIGLVNGAIRALNRLQVDVPKGVPLIGGQHFGLHIPTIPQLARGGVVSPSAGGSIVNVAEAGRPERITPLDSNGLSAGDRAVLDAVKTQGTPVTINVYAQPGQDVNQIAALVNREITFRQRKGATA